LDEKTRAQLLDIINFRLQSPDVTQSTVKVLKYLLDQGFSPDSYPYSPAKFSVWQRYVIGFIRAGPFSVAWEAMKAFLEHGVDPDFLFGLSQGEYKGDEGIYVEVKIGIGTSFRSVTERLWNAAETSILPILLATRSDISLRDLVQALQPNDVQEILNMIDRNLVLHEKPPIFAPPIDPIASVDSVNILSSREGDKLNAIPEVSKPKRLWPKVEVILSIFWTWRMHLSSFGICMSPAASPRRET
jgi:hypothetical protein